MHPDVTYAPYCTSSRGETGEIITFTQFEEGGLLSETRDDAESGDKSDDNSTMLPLLSEEEMDVMDSGDESDDEHMSTDMLEYIHGASKSHPSVNRRESRYIIRDCIKRRQTEWKGALSNRNIGKGLHKLFKGIVNDILQVLPPLSESGSEVSYLFQRLETLLK